MGETVIEKIIRNNVGHAVKPGDIVTVNVDRVMIHDIFIPFVAEKFEEMGFQKLWDPDKVVLIYDHLVPASQLDDTRHFHTGDAFAEKYGMKNVHRSDGICHQLMTEAGYVKPGNIVFGTDSHTTTYGCVGAFSSGIGYTEMASILGTGNMWIKTPGRDSLTQSYLRLQYPHSTLHLGATGRWTRPHDCAAFSVKQGWLVVSGVQGMSLSSYM